MGMECPNGHGRQNVIANINVEGKAIVMGSDVHIRKLACGCQVGGPEYEDFLEHVRELRTAESKAIVALREKTRQALAKEYAKYQSQEE